MAVKVKSETKVKNESVLESLAGSCIKLCCTQPLSTQFIDIYLINRLWGL